MHIIYRVAIYTAQSLQAFQIAYILFAIIFSEFGLSILVWKGAARRLSMVMEERSLESKHTRDAYIWNTAAGILHAFQSVIMLIVLTRVCDVYTAGVFTFAYANASLFLNVGKYGMRQFQVSDRIRQFSFGDYWNSRAFTCLSAVAIAVGYLFATAGDLGYSTDKIIAVFTMCFFKISDAAEDVYIGYYQQEGRLDIGAKAMTFRMIATIALFCLLIILVGELNIPLIISTIFTLAFVVGEVLVISRVHDMPFLPHDLKPSVKRIFELLKACFPLFAASFLLFYIGNAPKYAIDALLDDASQAYYGYIAMPVFIVSLLASFVYNPIITSLADDWGARNLRRFVTRFVKLGFVVVGITLVCDLIAWLIGVPVLDILYNTDLALYRTELIILITGGGCLALTTLITVGITIIRFQAILTPVYIVAAITSYFLAFFAARTAGIPGAAYAYLICMGFLSVLFIITFAIGIRLRLNVD